MNKYNTSIKNWDKYKNIEPEIQKKINAYFYQSCSYAMPFSGDDIIIMRELKTGVLDSPVCIYCVKFMNYYEIFIFSCCKYNYKDLNEDFVDIYKNVQNVHPNIIIANYMTSNITGNYSQIGNADNNTYVKKYENISQETHKQLEKFYKSNSTCEDFGIIHFKPKIKGDEGFLFFTKDKKSGNLIAVSYIKYNSIKQIGEMYSSCTEEAYRGTGKMKINVKNLLNYLQLIYPDIKRVWTGLDVNHNKFIQEANRKVKAGFVHTLSIDKETPLGIKTPFRFLSMWWEPSVVITQQMLNNVKIKINTLKNTYDHTYYISLLQIQYLNKIRNDNSMEEVGGSFNVDKLNHNLHISSDFVDSPMPNVLSTDKGLTPICTTGNFEELSILSFHTHPTGCYEKHKVQLAWPSAEDFTLILNMCFNKNAYYTLHFVISIEGIYSMRLSQQIVNMIRNGETTFINKMTNQMSSIIKYVAGEIKKTYGSRYQLTEYKKKQAIQTFLHVANGLNIEGILLFKVEFLSKENQIHDLKIVTY